MKLFTNNDTYKIYQGSMLDLLEVIEPNTIDSVVTDPPYELNFMNKGWDRSGIAFQKETWEKPFQALKPGGYLLAFGGSRTFHRIAVAIEDAGFEIRDVIMWVYGSGFPKSLDISKQFDKKGGNPLVNEELSEVIKKARKKRHLTVKYCDDKYCNGSTNWSWYEGRKDGSRVPDFVTFSKMCEEFEELIPYKELIKHLEREVVETYIRTENSGGVPLQGKRDLISIDITKPTSDLAKQWQGWGTALKPAYEPIIVARKPLKGTVAQNVTKYGVGAINIDECRVETSESDKYDIRHYTNEDCFINNKPKVSEFQVKPKNDLGRFPANFIHDGSDEVVELFPHTESGKMTSQHQRHTDGSPNGIYGKFDVNHPLSETYGDSGSASRFFYTAKASKKDRDEGLKLFETGKVGHGNLGNSKGFERFDTSGKNIHPTVKPCELMQYLVRLVTPKGGTVLDPFMGSGSTGKATMFENRERQANYKFIGIDLDLDNQYCEIANARIDYALNKFEYDELEIREQDKEKGQLSIFDFMGDE